MANNDVKIIPLDYRLTSKILDVVDILKETSELSILKSIDVINNLKKKSNQHSLIKDKHEYTLIGTGCFLGEEMDIKLEFTIKEKGVNSWIGGQMEISNPARNVTTNTEFSICPISSIKPDESYFLIIVNGKPVDWFITGEKYSDLSQTVPKSYTKHSVLDFNIASERMVYELQNEVEQLKMKIKLLEK